MDVDFDALEICPESMVDAVCEAGDIDQAAPLLFLVVAMRELMIDGVTQDAILTAMHREARKYLTGSE